MSKAVLAALCTSLVVIAACGPKPVAPPPIASGAPRFPEFVAPTVPAAAANTPAAQSESRGWAYLQLGDLKNAERELSDALKAAPDFVQAETALGYVELARKDAKAAVARFDRSLQRAPADPSALVGRGQASLALNREADALAAFRAAVAADPSLTEIAQRVQVLQFRGLGQGLADARTAAREGRLDDAIRAFGVAIASSPDSPFLYRELAVVERQKGDVDSAIEHLRKSVQLDPSDASSFVQLGDLLEAKGDLDGAAKAYSDALAIEPSDQLSVRLEGVRARAELARLPAEYRAIEGAPQVTRGDLAALIGIRLAPLLQTDARRDLTPITDLRTHWAATWIVTVARAGVMDPFENHAFQPRAVVRRVDLAQTVARILTTIAARTPSRAKAWESARMRFPDLAPGHLAFPAASAAVASGVLTVGPDGRFQPTRAVSGAEALEAIRRLETLAGLPTANVAR